MHALGEVSVFDDNATALGIDISDLMGAAGQGLAAQAVQNAEQCRETSRSGLDFVWSRQQWW